MANTTPTVSSALDSNLIGTNIEAIHVSTSRLTQSIQLHTFHIQPPGTLKWQPSQQVTLQLPTNLDMIGSSALDADRRKLILTPCNVHVEVTHSGPVDEEFHTGKLIFVTRSGTVTSQLGLPRFQNLRAEVLGVDGGFNWDVSDGPVIAAVAGGIGISPILSYSQARAWASNCEAKPTLYWTFHIEDWNFLTYTLENRLLLPEIWREVHIFLTNGPEQVSHQQSYAAFRGCNGLTNILRNAYKAINLHFHCRRIEAKDLASPVADEYKSRSIQSHILFSGSKALEWQVKMWGRMMSPPTIIQTVQTQP